MRLVYGIYMNRRIVAICDTPELAKQWKQKDYEKYPHPRNSNSYPEVISMNLIEEEADIT